MFKSLSVQGTCYEKNTDIDYAWLESRPTPLGTIKGIVRYGGNHPPFCLINTWKTVLKTKQNKPQIILGNFEKIKKENMAKRALLILPIASAF